MCSRCGRYGSSRCSWFSGGMVVSFLVCVKTGLAITLEVALITRELKVSQCIILGTTYWTDVFGWV